MIGQRRETVKRGANRDGGPSSVQVGIRLDPAVADRLRGGKGGLSEEIRARLERTFKYDEVDAVTRELVEGLINIAALLRDDFIGDWHAWPGAYEAFKAAVVQRLSAYAPGPGTAVDPESKIQEDELETIGRVRERDDRRAHDYQRLNAAQGRIAPDTVRIEVKVKKAQS
jgi:hypothetical protein